MKPGSLPSTPVPDPTGGTARVEPMGVGGCGLQAVGLGLAALLPFPQASAARQTGPGRECHAATPSTNVATLFGITTHSLGSAEVGSAV